MSHYCNACQYVGNMGKAGCLWRDLDLLHSPLWNRTMNLTNLVLLTQRLNDCYNTHVHLC